MASLFGFGPSAKLEITLDDQEGRQTYLAKSHEKPAGEALPIYSGDDKVSGKVKVILPPGKKLEHLGIMVELRGVTELYYDRSQSEDFVSLVQELEVGAGTLTSTKEYEFSFDSVDKPHESYNGNNVRVRYYVIVTASKSYSSNLTKEQEFWVQSVGTAPEINNSIKMEVGIEDCLHIEFEYDKAKYFLKDVVMGKIYFLLVRIKIKHMELTVIKRENVGSRDNITGSSDTVTKFEVMDGAPVRGESIPIRLFLEGYPLSPTYNVPGRFTVRYYLNLVLIDEDDRRYFKQQEIKIWRKDIG